MFSEGKIIYDSAGVNTAGVTAGGRLKVDLTGETVAITAASLPLPTGAATEATLLSIDGELNTITAALNSIDAGIPVALGQTIMANSMPVVIASDQSEIKIAINTDSVGLALESTLQTVNNTIRATQYPDDAPHGVGDVGHFVLAVRNDNLATIHTDADGDYSPFSVNQRGALYVIDQAVEDNTTTIAAAILAEDAPHVSGDRGIMALAVRNDLLATTYGANGDYSPISVDDSGAVAIWDGNRSITVDGTVAISSIVGTVSVSQSGVWNINDISGAISLPTGASTLAEQQTQTTALSAIQTAVQIMDDWDEADRAKVNPIVGQAGVAAGAGTTGANTQRVVIVTDQTAIPATQSGTWTVVAAGDVAHDAIDSGNPVKIGGHVEQGLPTAAANADRANMITDRYGRPMVTHIDPASFVSKSFNATTSQTGATIWQPSTANHRIAITKLAIGTYGTTSGRVIIWFGSSADTTYTAGTDQLVFASSYAPSTSSKPGAVLIFTVPEFCLNTNYYLRITTDANISIDVAVSGYEFIP